MKLINLSELCKRRIIPKAWESTKNTPILIPSFSSIISNFEKPMKLQKTYNNIKESVPYTSLISAFDLYYEELKYDSIKFSELTFIDSGNYEFLNHKINHKDIDWNLERYIVVINKLEPVSPMAIISFDEYIPFNNQIENARNLFTQFPDYIHDFLLKPEIHPKDANNLIWNFRSLEDHKDNLCDFDIIGVAEKDLGVSIYQRCQNLIELRKLVGTEKPIHIFGCFDQQGVVLYNLLGADLFDGTSWLRYYFWRGHALYFKQFSLLEELWTNRVDHNNIKAIEHNLDQSRKLEQKLRQFINAYKFELLDLDESIINNIKKIINELGVDYNGI